MHITHIQTHRISFILLTVPVSFLMFIINSRNTGNSQKGVVWIPIPNKQLLIRRNCLNKDKKMYSSLSKCYCSLIIFKQIKEVNMPVCIKRFFNPKNRKHIIFYFSKTTPNWKFHLSINSRMGGHQPLNHNCSRQP